MNVNKILRKIPLITQLRYIANQTNGLENFLPPHFASIDVKNNLVRSRSLERERVFFERDDIVKRSLSVPPNGAQVVEPRILQYNKQTRYFATVTQGDLRNVNIRQERNMGFLKNIFGQQEKKCPVPIICEKKVDKNGKVKLVCTPYDFNNPPNKKKYEKVGSSKSELSTDSGKLAMKVMQVTYKKDEEFAVPPKEAERSDLTAACNKLETEEQHVAKGMPVFDFEHLGVQKSCKPKQEPSCDDPMTITGPTIPSGKSKRESTKVEDCRKYREGYKKFEKMDTQTKCNGELQEKELEFKSLTESCPIVSQLEETTPCMKTMSPPVVAKSKPQTEKATNVITESAQQSIIASCPQTRNARSPTIVKPASKSLIASCPTKPESKLQSETVSEYASSSKKAATCPVAYESDQCLEKIISPLDFKSDQLSKPQSKNLSNSIKPSKKKAIPAKSQSETAFKRVTALVAVARKAASAKITSLESQLKSKTSKVSPSVKSVAKPKISTPIIGPLKMKLPKWLSYINIKPKLESSAKTMKTISSPPIEKSKPQTEKASNVITESAQQSIIASCPQTSNAKSPMIIKPVSKSLIAYCRTKSESKLQPETDSEYASPSRKATSLVDSKCKPQPEKHTSPNVTKSRSQSLIAFCPIVSESKPQLEKVEKSTSSPVVPKPESLRVSETDSSSEKASCPVAYESDQCLEKIICPLDFESDHLPEPQSKNLSDSIKSQQETIFKRFAALVALVRKLASAKISSLESESKSKTSKVSPSVKSEEKLPKISTPIIRPLKLKPPKLELESSAKTKTKLDPPKNIPVESASKLKSETCKLPPTNTAHLSSKMQTSAKVEPLPDTKTETKVQLKPYKIKYASDPYPRDPNEEQCAKLPFRPMNYVEKPSVIDKPCKKSANVKKPCPKDKAIAIIPLCSVVEVQQVEPKEDSLKNVVPLITAACPKECVVLNTAPKPKIDPEPDSVKNACPKAKPEEDSAKKVVSNPTPITASCPKIVPKDPLKESNPACPKECGILNAAPKPKIDPEPDSVKKACPKAKPEEDSAKKVVSNPTPITASCPKIVPKDPLKESNPACPKECGILNAAPKPKIDPEPDSVKKAYPKAKPEEDSAKKVVSNPTPITASRPKIVPKDPLKESNHARPKESGILNAALKPKIDPEPDSVKKACPKAKPEEDSAKKVVSNPTPITASRPKIVPKDPLKESNPARPKECGILNAAPKPKIDPEPDSVKKACPKAKPEEDSAKKVVSNPTPITASRPKIVPKDPLKESNPTPASKECNPCKKVKSTATLITASCPKIVPKNPLKKPNPNLASKESISCTKIESTAIPITARCPKIDTFKKTALNPTSITAVCPQGNDLKTYAFNHFEDMEDPYKKLSSRLTQPITYGDPKCDQECEHREPVVTPTIMRDPLPCVIPKQDPQTEVEICEPKSEGTMICDKCNNPCNRNKRKKCDPGCPASRKHKRAPVEGTCNRFCPDDNTSDSFECRRCRKYAICEDPKPKPKPIDCFACPNIETRKCPPPPPCPIVSSCCPKPKPKLTSCCPKAPKRKPKPICKPKCPARKKPRCPETVPVCPTPNVCCHELEEDVKYRETPVDDVHATEDKRLKPCPIKESPPPSKKPPAPALCPSKMTHTAWVPVPIKRKEYGGKCGVAHFKRKGSDGYARASDAKHRVKRKTPNLSGKLPKPAKQKKSFLEGFKGLIKSAMVILPGAGKSGRKGAMGAAQTAPKKNVAPQDHLYKLPEMGDDGKVKRSDEEWPFKVDDKKTEKTGSRKSGTKKTEADDDKCKKPKPKPMCGSQK